MGFIVDIWLDVTRIVSGAAVGHLGDLDDLFDPGRCQFVTLEPGEPVLRSILRLQEGAFLDDQHGMAGANEFLRDRSTAGAAADDHNIEIGTHKIPPVWVVQPR
jgi:hypothetical protein